MSHDFEQEHDYEYRYQVTRQGQKVGWFEAEWHGAARGEIHHPDSWTRVHLAPLNDWMQHCMRVALR